ncbi:MAG: hypothetical protein U0414_05300 [Polyangiaceae bacterium]
MRSTCVRARATTIVDQPSSEKCRSCRTSGVSADERPFSRRRAEIARRSSVWSNVASVGASAGESSNRSIVAGSPPPIVAVRWAATTRDRSRSATTSASVT